MGSARTAIVLMGASEGNSPAMISEAMKTRIGLKARLSDPKQMIATKFRPQGSPERKKKACKELEWWWWWWVFERRGRRKEKNRIMERVAPTVLNSHGRKRARECE